MGLVRVRESVGNGRRVSASERGVYFREELWRRAKPLIERRKETVFAVFSRTRRGSRERLIVTHDWRRALRRVDFFFLFIRKRRRFRGDVDGNRRRRKRARSFQCELRFQLRKSRASLPTSRWFTKRSCYVQSRENARSWTWRRERLPLGQTLLRFHFI